MSYLLPITVGYLIGAVPIGYVVVKLWTGRNVFEVGSGRSGATNVLRAAGWTPALITLFADLTKGALAIFLVHSLLGDRVAAALAGIAAVLGHNASLFVWLITRRLEGGAGASTFVGGAILLWPPIALLLVPLVPLLLYITGYSSVTSTALAATAMIVSTTRALYGIGPWADALYAVAGGALIMIALRPNYARLRQGTERMIGPRAKRQAARQSPRSAPPGASVNPESAPPGNEAAHPY